MDRVERLREILSENIDSSMKLSLHSGYNYTGKLLKIGEDGEVLHFFDWKGANIYISIVDITSIEIMRDHGVTMREGTQRKGNY